MHTLYIVATPIGNLEDITVRAIKILLHVPVIACEDTRRTGILIRILKDRYSENNQTQSLIGSEPFVINPQKKFVSIRDWNEAGKLDEIINLLGESDVALVSDAGTPLISDPGFKVVRRAKQEGFPVVPIPGACAAVTALSAAGLPTNKFMFWGFPTKKDLSANTDLETGITHIFYESPKRINSTVGLIKARYPKSQIVLARELTKIHEDITPYKEEKYNSNDTKKGEVTIMVYIPDS